MVNETNPSSKGVTLDGDTILKIVQGLNNLKTNALSKYVGPVDYSIFTQTNAFNEVNTPWIPISGNNLILAIEEVATGFLYVGFNNGPTMQFTIVDGGGGGLRIITFKNWTFRNLRFGLTSGIVRGITWSADIDGSPTINGF